MSVEINRGISTLRDQRPRQIDQTKIDEHQFIPKQFKDVAQNMEQQFAEYMINEMNKSIEENPDENSTGMDYYKGLQTTEQAKIMSQKKNLGLQEVILDQIYPKRLRNEIALKQYEAQVDRIHHNLPKLEASKKNDTITIGKNDSSSDEKEGGLK